jgi:hypothetical protein
VVVQSANMRMARRCHCRASRANHSRRPEFAVMPGGRTLIAAIRSRRVS